MKTTFHTIGHSHTPFVMKNLILFIFLLGPITLFAQPETTMLTLTGVPQHSNYNPAFVPNYKFVLSVGTSSVHAHYSNSSFSYNDIAVKRGDSLVIDLPRFQDALHEKNYLTTAADAEVFRLGIKLSPRLYFNWYVTSKVLSRQMIPKDLTTLFINGTAGFIGGTASFSPQVEAMAYLESAWGASYMVNDKLTVGARFKALRGLVNASTEDTELNLSLDNDYAMTATASVNARTSGIQNLDDVDFAKDYKDFLKNKGVAIDLGATFAITKKFTVGASLLDIGGITWKNDTYAYTLDPEQATYTFNGIDLQKILDGDNDYFDAEMDSLEAKFELQEGAIGSYRTPLPGKVYLTANYALKRKTTVGALLFMEKFQGRFYPGFSASVHKEFWRIAGASISYTAVNRGFGNLGAGFNLNLTPFQFYVVGDNLLRMPLSYLANGSYSEFVGSVRYFNLRAGLNFVFGRVKSQEKIPYNKRKR